MLIFPAIDIRGGKCVRLVKGDFHQETVFSDKPEEMAQKWQEQGAQYLHLVDLDGALAGKSVNLPTVRAIVQTVNIPAELGGGIRTMQNIDEVLGLGVQRVILGSVAVRDQELVRKACAKYGERIVVGQKLQALVLRLLAGNIGEHAHIVRWRAGRVARHTQRHVLGKHLTVLAPVPDFTLPAPGALH